MKIPLDVLCRMLEPGKVIVRPEFRCQCGIPFIAANTPPGAVGCIRAATEEDGLCDGCREHCGGWPRRGLLWVSDIESRSLVSPADRIWPPRHTCLVPDRQLEDGTP